MGRQRTEGMLEFIGSDVIIDDVIILSAPRDIELPQRDQLNDDPRVKEQSQMEGERIIIIHVLRVSLYE